MSRRHAGGRARHHNPGGRAQREAHRAAPLTERSQVNLPAARTDAPRADAPPAGPARPDAAHADMTRIEPVSPDRRVVESASLSPADGAPVGRPGAPRIAASPIAPSEPAPFPSGPAASAVPDASVLPAGAPPPRTRPGYDGGCTAPQLRRFIKSRAYVPMHELRRRFGINGAEDDVTPVAIDGARVFLGLPAREGQMLGELLRAGEVGFELSLDPVTPIVVGVYPMRPVPRP